MADQVALRKRPMPALSVPDTNDVFFPLPTDVMPNIMLRVEDRGDFSQLASTCRAFYVWSQPWLKSRRAAAALNADPQRLTKLPAWIKTHSQHLHHADWHAIQRWDNAGENRILINKLRRSAAFTKAIEVQPDSMRSASETSAAHLDFLLFSPRLQPDVNADVTEHANARLKGSARFALAGFMPVGEAWECDVVAGAAVWLGKNAGEMHIDPRSKVIEDLSYAMDSVMVAQKSPALATQLLEHGLVQSYHFSVSFSKREASTRWACPLLRALVVAARNCDLKPGSSGASAFLSALHRVVGSLAEKKETEALTMLVDEVADMLALMSASDLVLRNDASAWLLVLVKALVNEPHELGMIQDAVLQGEFISRDEWEDFLLLALPAAEPQPG